jgi:hypothetical protein
MAIGAHKAFDEAAKVFGRQRWQDIKYLGCDGLEEFGHKWVTSGRLNTTIIRPILTRIAIELLAKARLTKILPPAVTYTQLAPFPSHGDSVTPERLTPRSQNRDSTTTNSRVAWPALA